MIFVKYGFQKNWRKKWRRKGSLHQQGFTSISLSFNEINCNRSSNIEYYEWFKLILHSCNNFFRKNVPTAIWRQWNKLSKRARIRKWKKEKSVNLHTLFDDTCGTVDNLSYFRVFFSLFITQIRPLCKWGNGNNETREAHRYWEKQQSQVRGPIHSDDNATLKALIYFFIIFEWTALGFIAALPAPARIGEGGRQRLHLPIEIKSHGSSKDVTSLPDKFRCGQLFLNDQIGSLAPEGFLGNKAELATTQCAILAVTAVDTTNVMLRPFFQIGDCDVKNGRNGRTIRHGTTTTPAAKRSHVHVVLVVQGRTARIAVRGLQFQISRLFSNEQIVQSFENLLAGRWRSRTRARDGISWTGRCHRISHWFTISCFVASRKLLQNELQLPLQVAVHGILATGTSGCWINRFHFFGDHSGWWCRSAQFTRSWMTP